MDLLENIVESDEATYDQKCVPLLLLSGQEIEARLNRTSSKFGLSYLQYLILRLLSSYETGTTTISELGEHLTQKTNISRSVTQLIKMELVTKERSSEDERVVYVTITEKGTELTKTIDASMMSLYTLGLDEADAKALHDLLAKVMVFQASFDA